MNFCLNCHSSFVKQYKFLLFSITIAGEVLENDYKSFKKNSNIINIVIYVYVATFIAKK